MNQPPKHDGNLGDGYEIEIRALGRYVLLSCEGRDDYPFTPQQALSLLAWLRQEEETLKQMERAAREA